MSKTLLKILGLSWIGYAVYYFLRVNFPIAIPGIMQEFSLTKTEIGAALTAFFALYAIGQFLNGQLADNIGPKKLYAIGLIGSILLNFLLPSVGGLIILITIVWGLNGIFQSMGWSPNVKIISAWTPFKIKGRVAAILSTSYILGGALAGIFAGYLAEFGWRYVFYGPIVLGIVVFALWLKFAKEAPRGKVEKTDFKYTLRTVLRDKRVWFAGMGLFGLNIVRYGFIDWIPTYFFEVQKAAISTAAYKSALFPLAGGVGALSVGWLADKIFKNRRTVLGLIMTISLAVSAFLFIHTTSWVLGLLLLIVIGFATFGDHSLLVGQLPMFLGNRKNVGSITGFIDGLGYVGASLTGVVSGWLIDTYSWNHAFYFWIIGGIIGGIFVYKTNVSTFGKKAFKNERT